jgi:hypothetical protein
MTYKLLAFIVERPDTYLKNLQHDINKLHKVVKTDNLKPLIDENTLN